MRTGTFDNPFAHLIDALTLSQEIAAPYFDTINITIHLFKGYHAITENRFDALNIYFP
jgi:hypothetical protein